MAFFAGCPLAVGMLVVLLMAANAGGGRIFELVGGAMTLFAGDFFMLTNQAETSHSMIKLGILPTQLVMTGLAGAAKFFTMGIILKMALSAFGGRFIKIDQLAGAVVTFLAGQLNMDA